MGRCPSGQDPIATFPYHDIFLIFTYIYIHNIFIVVLNYICLINCHSFTNRIAKGFEAVRASPQKREKHDHMMAELCLLAFQCVRVSMQGALQNRKHKSMMSL